MIFVNVETGEEEQAVRKALAPLGLPFAIKHPGGGGEYASEPCGRQGGPVNPTCHDCGAQAGEPHDEGCDVARCLQTGYQRLACFEEHDHGPAAQRTNGGQR